MCALTYHVEETTETFCSSRYHECSCLLFRWFHSSLATNKMKLEKENISPSLNTFFFYQDGEGFCTYKKYFVPFHKYHKDTAWPKPGTWSQQPSLTHDKMNLKKLWLYSQKCTPQDYINYSIIWRVQWTR